MAFEAFNFEAADFNMLGTSPRPAHGTAPLSVVAVHVPTVDDQHAVFSRLLREKGTDTVDIEAIITMVKTCKVKAADWDSPHWTADRISKFTGVGFVPASNAADAMQVVAARLKSFNNSDHVNPFLVPQDNAAVAVGASAAASVVVVQTFPEVQKLADLFTDNSGNTGVDCEFFSYAALEACVVAYGRVLHIDRGFRKKPSGAYNPYAKTQSKKVVEQHQNQLALNADLDNTADAAKAAIRYSSGDFNCSTENCPFKIKWKAARGTHRITILQDACQFGHSHPIRVCDTNNGKEHTKYENQLTQPEIDVIHSYSGTPYPIHCKGLKHLLSATFDRTYDSDLLYRYARKHQSNTCGFDVHRGDVKHFFKAGDDLKKAGHCSSFRLCLRFRLRLRPDLRPNLTTPPLTLHIAVPPLLHSLTVACNQSSCRRSVLLGG